MIKNKSSNFRKFCSPLSVNVAVIGVGYVGLPIAYNLAKSKNCIITKKRIHHEVIAYDINKNRIEELKSSVDKTREIRLENLKKIKNLSFTYLETDLYKSDVFIVTVPTPITKNNHPNLSPLENACLMIGEILNSRTNKNKFKPIIIVESTVYPGATEEFCAPIIEKKSKLIFNTDFFMGYSPERINPGDKERDITDIIKVTSGSDKETGEWINQFYGSFISAGTHYAPNIKVAEAAKVIENTQRDINIALINELSIIFKKLNIDTLDVLEAAQTKWNFLPFKPGLVGGHCIGVDPYYLTYKSEQLGYYPEIVLAGRRLNNNMSNWIVELVFLEAAKNKINICKSNILILGFTFKENCPDFRNTKVLDLIINLKNYGPNIDIVDPLVNIIEVEKEHNIKIEEEIIENKKYDIVIAALAHDLFLKYKKNKWKNLVNKDGLLIDIKGIIPRELNPIRI